MVVGGSIPGSPFCSRSLLTPRGRMKASNSLWVAVRTGPVSANCLRVLCLTGNWGNLIHVFLLQGADFFKDVSLGDAMLEV